MKNVDVPMWDKGDDTDDFSKGGGSSSLGNIGVLKSKDPGTGKLFKLILGREPSSREAAFYKYSSLKKEEIIEKLLKGEEHKNILEKAKKFPELVKENKKSESSLLKLKSLIQDKEKEFIELEKLLQEKSEIIEELRKEKESPFLKDRKLIEEADKQFRVFTTGYSKEKQKKPETLLDRLHYLIFGEDK
ncbi:MAG: hypothetical protein PHP96_00205 [Candidatus Dojkabacteria bacterium]|nr:hypothetical protein [Candidatus Dojkabacteria bacterium]MDD4561174.1 hypothetical protein [Candidatus Dojkabacteria bacterium]